MVSTAYSRCALSPNDAGAAFAAVVGPVDEARAQEDARVIACAPELIELAQDLPGGCGHFPGASTQDSRANARGGDLVTDARHSNGRVHRFGSALRVGHYARVSTHDQHTLPMQTDAMRAHARRRGWQVARHVEDVGSGARDRSLRVVLMEAARRREVDAILAGRLDRWGRSLTDLVVTLHDLAALDVGFVSLTEALDLTTPTGRAMSGMLAVFADYAEREILRERVKAGFEQAPRQKGRWRGRPLSAALLAPKVRKLSAQKVSQAEIARRLSIGRASVRRILAAPPSPDNASLRSSG
ncbi:MAG TPA: recombinase family protein [Anaeromyxobacteraceae bacterium]|nr:recombinase family protein [Anaeromyxobacteraceae bacterium]